MPADLLKHDFAEALVPSPGRIEAGRIELAGRDVMSLEGEELRQVRGALSGMVFQNPMTALNPSFAVGWQLMEPLRARGVRDKTELRHRAQAALAAVGMPDPARQLETYPHQMSGGMRQRVVIAMGMINEPRLLIADEPTTALDVTIQAQVLNLMKQLTREHGTALLLITHNMGVVARMCDRVAVMYAGEIVEEAPVRKLFAAPKHPYTSGLLQSIPRADHGRGKVPTMKGFPPDMAAPPVGCRFAARCPYVEEACLQERPALLEVESGHKTRCLRVQKLGGSVADLTVRGVA